MSSNYFEKLKNEHIFVSLVQRGDNKKPTTVDRLTCGIDVHNRDELVFWCGLLVHEMQAKHSVLLEGGKHDDRRVGCGVLQNCWVAS